MNAVAAEPGRAHGTGQVPVAAVLMMPNACRVAARLPSAPRHRVTVDVTSRMVDVMIAGRPVARLRLHRAGRSFAAGGIELTGQRGAAVSAMPQIGQLRIAGNRG